MALFEYTTFPGAPYLVAGVLALWALLHTYEFPTDPEVVYAKFNTRSQDSESFQLLAIDSDLESIS